LHQLLGYYRDKLITKVVTFVSITPSFVLMVFCVGCQWKQPIDHFLG